MSDRIWDVKEGDEVFNSACATRLMREAATAILPAACIGTMVWLTAHGLWPTAYSAVGRATTETGGDNASASSPSTPRWATLQPELSEQVSVPTTMPAGAPFHSFIRPYPIRVDAFATPADASDYQVPCLHLLTHSHTDHLDGLSSNTFGATVICSPAAKEMLLDYEPTHERIAYDKGLRHDRLRPYAKLRIDPIKTKDGKMDYTYARDLLVSWLHWTGYPSNLLRSARYP